ncbi:hypothetical protein BT96DRAFT_913095 [Gymnopus androsaceus JB14]|uniref:Uncharacterized protein n=1 Tax=Gymnopus androsaceus JB14 TaxID=1447944 RepID=A0A6A4IG25_9AGAR|nr:hypothetical protein BT96DRAFT_913095 [Gymnopus androsaceus JB14]
MSTTSWPLVVIFLLALRSIHGRRFHNFLLTLLERLVKTVTFSDCISCLARRGTERDWA